MSKPWPLAQRSEAAATLSSPPQTGQVSRSQTSLSTGRRRAPARSVAPDVAGHVHYQAQLRDLLVEGQLVALHRGGETGLRRQAELVQRDVTRRLVDPPLDDVGVLEFAALGRDEAEHHHLALGH